MESDPSSPGTSVQPKTERIIKKIPGKILPLPKENEVYLKDLSAKSIADLQELLERQDRILSNKALVSKLADKGSKAADLKARIENELKARNEVEKAANLLSQMSLGQLNALEWTGHCNPGRKSKTSAVEGDDPEESDPLKIMASHSGTTAQKKHISIIKPVESLIKPEDLIDCEDLRGLKDSVEGSETTPSSNKLAVEEFQSKHAVVKPLVNGKQDHSFGKETLSSGSLPLVSVPSFSNEPEPYAQFICEHFGHKEAKERFKPNKPLKPFCGTFPFKPSGRVSSRSKQWEETNVTPPIAVYGDTKLLSLEESIELQREQNQKLREVQIKHAAEKLVSMPGIRMTEKIPASVLESMAYRGPTLNSDSEEDIHEDDLEDQEHHDEDQLDHGTTVVYNIES